MQSHLSTAKLERDGRTSTFNDLAARCFEQRLDARPLNVSIDGIREHLQESLTLRAVHSRMIALTMRSAIIWEDAKTVPCEA